MIAGSIGVAPNAFSLLNDLMPGNNQGAVWDALGILRAGIWNGESLRQSVAP